MNGINRTPAPTTSGLEVKPAHLLSERFHIMTPGGKAMACRCARVFYWEDIGESYRASCCGYVQFERKRV